MAHSGRSRFALGLLTGLVVGVVGLFSIYYVPRKGLHLFDRELRFHVHFAAAHGLHAGDPVLLNGLEVGEVLDVALDPLPELGVRCVVTVAVFDAERHGPHLRADSNFTVVQEGLLGRRALAIVAGGAGPPIVDGAVIPGAEPRDLERTLDDLQATVAELRALLAGDRPGAGSLRHAVRDLEVMLRNLRDFSEKLPH